MAYTEYKLKIKEIIYIDEELPKMNVQIPSLGIYNGATQAKILPKERFHFEKLNYFVI